MSLYVCRSDALIIHLSKSLKCAMLHTNKSMSFTCVQVFEMCDAAHKHLHGFYINFVQVFEVRDAAYNQVHFVYICPCLWNVWCCTQTSPRLLHLSKSLKCAVLHTNISTSFTFVRVFEMCDAAYKQVHFVYICPRLWNVQYCTQTSPCLLHLSKSLKCAKPHINKSTSFTFVQVFEMCNAAYKQVHVVYICPSLWNARCCI